MKLYIFKTILKGKNKKIMLITELFFSFLAFFIISTFIVKKIDNSKFPLGFNFENVFRVDLDITSGNYNVETINKITNYIENYPGISGFGMCRTSNFFLPKGYQHPSKPLKYNNVAIPNHQVEFMGATDEISEILEIIMLEGRWFNKEDNASKNRPVVINRKLKETLSENSNIIGQIINYCDQQCIVVGVCNNFKHKGDFTEPKQLLILRHTDLKNLPYPTWYCMNGSNCGQSRFLKTINNMSHSFAPDLIRKVAVNYPGYNIKLYPMKKSRAKYIRSTWIPLVTISIIIAALFINVLFGLFGVLWYNILLRKSEIGLRMAVGANKKHIYRQFIEEMLILTTLGIVPGIIIAAQFPLLNIFHFETHVYIIAMLISIIIIYALVILCALIPSIQATKIQPAIALHEE